MLPVRYRVARQVGGRGVTIGKYGGVVMVISLFHPSRVLKRVGLEGMGLVRRMARGMDGGIFEKPPSPT